MLYQLDVSALDWRTADNAEVVKRWTLKKQSLFWLGHQRDRLERNRIRVTSYDRYRYRYRYRYCLLNLLPNLLNKIISRQLGEQLNRQSLVYIGAAFAYLVRAGMIAHNPVSRNNSPAGRPWHEPDEDTVIAMLERAE